MLKKTLIAALVCFASSAFALSTFEDLSYAPGRNFEDGANLSGSFLSGGARFSNSFTDAGTFTFWSGFSYSKVNNVTTPGFGNQYAAYDVPSGGKGFGGSESYGIFYSGSSATITLAPGQTTPVGMYVTNTTYAALSMVNGDSFSKKFGGATGNDPDFFLLTVFGFDASGASTGSVQKYLADYRFADNSQDYILNSWTWLDLGSLQTGTTTLRFGLSSSDNGAFGMNTPAYFALDNVTAVPEPMTLGLLALGLAALRRRRGSR
ncbi:MAG: DUF4465 domain-containing protein [Fimbriimonadaceae bacterium]|jgi:hypothetical protein|nr:DUF4465 domain-containing protein [Fimbriimonadaceae bacterium]